MTQETSDAAIEVPRETHAKLGDYVELLLQENERQNLISRSSVDDVWNRHIEDSLQLISHLPRDESADIVDLGSGPGLPGLVLAIARPGWTLHLVESRRKRCDFLLQTSAALNLENVRVHCSNVRSLSAFTVDAITARAFAPLPALIAMATPFAARRTQWVLPRGAKGAIELSELPRRHRSMFHVEHSVTDERAVILVGTGTP